jgi:stage II sporulation protein AB (anti-sigma F factor)
MADGDDPQDLREPAEAAEPAPREIRVASNQTTLRAINEAIEEGRRSPEGEIGFVCECGRLGCGVVVALRVDEYEHVRADGRQFLLAPGHESFDEDAVVVVIEGRYTIVAKLGGDAVQAQATDPRAERPAADLVWSGGDRVSSISMSVDATPQNVGEVRRWVLAFAAEHGASRDLRGRIAIAVAEAVGNAVIHAYEPGSTGGTVDVEIDVEDDEIEVVVADAGHGFRAEDPSGLGTGLPLIASTSDRFAIRERLPRGVEVWMRFSLTGDAPPTPTT